MSKAIHFIWSHGWGQQPEFFMPLSHQFPNAQHTFWNHGYFEPPIDRNLPASTKETVTIGVGHSLGFSHLLKSAPDLDAYVCLQGFCWFCPPGNGQPGVPKEMIQTMLKGLEKGSAKILLNNFNQQAGIDVSIDEPVNVDNLQQDLTWLGEVNAPWPTKPVLAIVAKNDVIVPASLTRQQARGHSQVLVKVLPEGNHALGLSQTETVANHIKDWLAGLV
jgi:predicted alpha/beta hydrolase family esterase